MSYKIHIFPRNPLCPPLSLPPSDQTLYILKQPMRESMAPIYIKNLYQMITLGIDNYGVYSKDRPQKGKMKIIIT